MRRVRTLQLLVAMSLVLVACGPGSDTARMGESADTPAIVRLGEPSLQSNTLGLAVVDADHALVVESSAGMLSAAATVDRDGVLTQLPQNLPEVGKVHVVGTADGFVIVGIRCLGAHAFNTDARDDQQLCSSKSDQQVRMAEPVAVGLDVDGSVRWSVVGPEVDPSRFGGVTPTRTGALLQLGDHWYVADKDGFSNLRQPELGHHEFNPCMLRDGQFVAFAADYSSVEDDAGGGTRQALVQKNGNWVPVGSPQTVQPGELLTSSCAVGGLVARTQVFVADKPVDARLGEIGLESIAGVTADGLLLVDVVPRGLIDPKSGLVDIELSNARYVALSWDGRTIAVASDRTVSMREQL